jgi:nucleoid-associated protein YgaU
MSLEKATLLNLDKSANYEVLFNPREYTVRKSTQWEPHKSPGLDSPEIEFTSGNSMTLSMELFFDTYEKRKDVREHTDKVLALAQVDVDLHRPPRVLFTWGGFKFEGILEEVTQRFTMFTNSGMPVRATLNVTFKEYKTAADQMSAKPRNSPDHTKRRTVKQGETLSLIAGEEYDDPSEWRRIADANNIADPRDVKPGTVLTVPPIL